MKPYFRSPNLSYNGDNSYIIEENDLIKICKVSETLFILALSIENSAQDRETSALSSALHLLSEQIDQALSIR